MRYCNTSTAAWIAELLSLTHEAGSPYRNLVAVTQVSLLPNSVNFLCPDGKIPEGFDVRPRPGS